MPQLTADDVAWLQAARARSEMCRSLVWEVVRKLIVLSAIGAIGGIFALTVSLYGSYLKQWLPTLGAGP